MDEEEAQGKIVARDTPQDIDAKRAALVGEWASRVKAAKGHWKTTFDRMRQDMHRAKMGADAEWIENAENYTANLIQRHINQRVAALYAKNPKAVAEPRQRIEHKVWDGDPQSLMIAQQMLASGMPDPQAIAIIQDVQEAQARKKMTQRVGKTLEVVFHHQLDEQEPNFKKQLKKVVRRTLAASVAFVTVDFIRAMEPSVELAAQVADLSTRLADIQRMAADAADGEMQEDDAEAETLRLQLQSLQQQKDVIVKEGLLFGYPKPMDIIPDPKTTDLDGWIGTDWIAQEFTLSPKGIQAIYKIDVGKGYSRYTPDDMPASSEEGDGDHPALAKLWKIQDKKSGMIFTICDGYPDFLIEPHPPAYMLERFFNVFTLIFNGSESHDGNPYPLSDSYLLRHMQNEHNSTRQRLRQHRNRNVPGWVSPKGALEDPDKSALTNNVVNALVEVSGLMPGQDIKSVLQPKPTAPVDPNMYTTQHIEQDIYWTVGAQEASLGVATGDKTATESSIAAGSQQSSSSSNVDDLDEFLTEIARASGSILLQLMSPETAMKIAGPGGLWPKLTNQELADEIFLKIRAGSSGRPNKGIEIANMERMAPFLVQLPGISQTWLAKKAVERLDDDIDLEEAIAEGIPSIVAQNSLMGRQMGAGAGQGPEADPSQQGARGQDNAPQAAQQSPGGQPAFPV
jgi:hypothetical protein